MLHSIKAHGGVSCFVVNLNCPAYVKFGIKDSVVRLVLLISGCGVLDAATHYTLAKVSSKAGVRVVALGSRGIDCPNPLISLVYLRVVGKLGLEHFFLAIIHGRRTTLGVCELGAELGSGNANEECGSDHVRESKYNYRSVSLRTPNFPPRILLK